MNWVIGDVHGMFDELKKLLDDIRDVDSEPQFWFVGDYCDRGPKSKQVVDLLLELGHDAHCCRGNHDDLFDLILNGPTKHGELQGEDARAEALQWFLNFGMDATLFSYSISERDINQYGRSADTIDQITRWIPKEHKEFYKNLPMFLETDDFFIVHASLPPDCTMPLEEMVKVTYVPEAMLWGRFTREHIDVEKGWTKEGYFGHTPTNKYNNEKSIITGPKITLVDTGAFSKKGNGLTAVCHETKQVLNVPQRITDPPWVSGMR